MQHKHPTSHERTAVHDYDNCDVKKSCRIRKMSTN